VRLSWGLRVLMPVLVLALYAGLWRPVRVWIVQQGTTPLLAKARTGGWTVTPQKAPPVVLLAYGTEHHTLPAPAGRSFLLPALLLAAAAPQALHWLRLFGVALALGLAGLVCALLTVRDVPGAGPALGFLDTYVTVPLLMGLALFWIRPPVTERPDPTRAT
jgi:hypothetical protein